MIFYASGWVGIPNNKVYSVSNSYYVPKGNGYVGYQSKIWFK
jgi:hypothetical protein